MSHTHTAGPWQVERNNPCRDTFIGPVMGGQRIAEVFNRVEGDGWTVANANLLAAAPELLSACEQAIHWIGSSDRCPNLKAALIHAIAKARGAA